MQPPKPPPRVGFVIILVAVCTLAARPLLGQTPGKLEPEDPAFAGRGFIHAEAFRLRYRVEGKGRPAIVVGSAVYYPRIFSHVILIGAAPDMSAASTAAAERYWQESASPQRKAALRENMRTMPDSEIAKLPPSERLVKSYIQIGPRAWYDFRFDATPLWAGVELNADAFDYLWNTVFRDIDITNGPRGFDRPVFLALGRHDFVVAPPSSWDRIKPIFASLTLRIFEHSGHTPPYEEPELFDQELMRFIENH